MSSEKDLNNSLGQDDQSPATRRAEIVQSLTQRLTARVFDMWFDRGRSIVVGHRGVEILATNEFLLNRIKKTYINQIREAVDEVCGPGFTVQCRMSSAQSSDTNCAVKLPAKLQETRATEVKPDPLT